MSGFVYVLKNESMPGVVKIGFTTRLPQSRAEELFTSGVPSPFEIHSSIWFDDPKSIECELHEDLEHLRVSPSREFFRIGPDEATALLAGKMLNAIGHAVVEEWAYVCPEIINELRESAGLNLYETAGLVERLIRQFSRQARQEQLGEGQYDECLSIT